MKKRVLDIHDYQLKLFGLAFSLYGLFWAMRKLLHFYGLDQAMLVRGLGWIMLILFATLLLHYREEIWKREIKQLTVWTLTLWVALGVALIAYHVRAHRLLSLDTIFFLLFTLFLADSYWDFKDVPGAHLFDYTRNK